MTADHGPLCPNGVRCPDCGWPVPPEHDAAIAARAAADALVAFADAHRMPFVMFRREDGSAVTVSDLLREESARLRGRAEQVNP